jgi:hypothetical protein
MSAHPTTPTLSRYQVEAGAGWDHIVSLTVEACLHRSEGRERIAAKILQESLPTAIRSWSLACGASAASCKESLKAMFSRVREQVAIASVQRRMILAELSLRAPAPAERVAPARSAAPAPVCLRERIRFDDVSGMLDALAGAEADCASLRPAVTLEAERLALSV